MNMQHLQSFEDQTRLNSNYMKELEHTNCKNIRHASRKKNVGWEKHIKGGNQGNKGALLSNLTTAPTTKERAYIIYAKTHNYITTA